MVHDLSNYWTPETGVPGGNRTPMAQRPPCFDVHTTPGMGSTVVTSGDIQDLAKRFDTLAPSVRQAVVMQNQGAGWEDIQRKTGISETGFKDAVSTAFPGGNEANALDSRLNRETLGRMAHDYPEIGKGGRIGDRLPIDRQVGILSNADGINPVLVGSSINKEGKVVFGDVGIPGGKVLGDHEKLPLGFGVTVNNYDPHNFKNMPGIGEAGNTGQYPFHGGESQWRTENIAAERATRVAQYEAMKAKTALLPGSENAHVPAASAAGAFEEATKSVGSTGSHLGNIAHAAGNVGRHGLKVLPFVGAGVAAAEAAVGTAHAVEGLKSGELTPAQFAAVTTGQGASVAGSFVPLIGGEAGAETARAVQQAAGVPEKYQTGTLRTSLGELGTAIVDATGMRGESPELKNQAAASEREKTGEGPSNRITQIDDDKKNQAIMNSPQAEKAAALLQDPHATLSPVQDKMRADISQAEIRISTASTLSEPGQDFTPRQQAEMNYRSQVATFIQDVNQPAPASASPQPQRDPPPGLSPETAAAALAAGTKVNDGVKETAGQKDARAMPPSQDAQLSMAKG